MKPLYVLFLLCLFSCSNHKEQKQNVKDNHLGKYIYRDDNFIHHINPNCTKLNYGTDDAGHRIYAKHMIDTAEFVIVDPQNFRVCTHCVNDKEYEHLLQISYNNSMFDDSVALVIDDSEFIDTTATLNEW